jgi:hypothetical protein
VLETGLEPARPFGHQSLNPKNPDGLTGLKSVDEADSAEEDRHRRERERRDDPGREHPSPGQQVARATEFGSPIGEMQLHVLRDPRQGVPFS